MVCQKIRQTTQYGALEIYIIHLAHDEAWLACRSKDQDYQGLF